jgi:hypothetical protein
MGFDASGAWVRKGSTIVLYPSTPSAPEQEELSDVIRQLSEMWRAQPKEVQSAILNAVAYLFMASRAEVARIMNPVGALVLQGVPLLEAARRVGARHGLRPRTRPPKPRPSTAQVRQYQARQLRRGRRPGLDPRLQRKRK